MRTLTYTAPTGQSITIGDGTQYGIYDNGIQGLGAPKLNLQTQKAPYQDGATFIDALDDIREIVVTGSMNTQVLSTIQSLRKALEQVINGKLGVGTLIYTYNGTSYSIPAIPGAQSPLYKNRNWTSMVQTYQLNFECLQPHWQSPTVSNVVLPVNVTVAIQNDSDINIPISCNIVGVTVNPKVLQNNTTQYFSFTKTNTALQASLISPI